MVFSVPSGKKILWDCRLSNLSLHKNTLVNNHCSLSGVRNLLYWKLKKKKNSSSLACLRPNTWFELAEDTKNMKYIFFSILTSILILIFAFHRTLFIQKNLKRHFSSTHPQPNWTQEIAADSSAISQPWLTTNMRRSKRIHNSAGAAAQPCLMQNYHKALVLFSKAQQLDFLFCAFFSLLVREPMPTTESVVGCKLFMKNLPKRTIKPKGVFKESFDLHTRSFFIGQF